MKKKTLATALALTCALSLAACGETGSSVPAPEVSVSTSVSEETKTSVSEETPASTETSESTAASGENNESSEPIFSEPGEGELNINGVWRNDKNLSNWIVIQNLGQGWSLYDELGEELFYGNIELNGCDAGERDTRSGRGRAGEPRCSPAGPCPAG